MSRIPEFGRTIAKILKLHEAKNQDYAKESDPFSNFRFTEYVLDHFPNNRDKSFVWPIATKLARLSVLLSSTAKPNFESIEDSFDDIATYVILWKCEIMRHIAMQEDEPEQSAEPNRELLDARMQLAAFIGTLSEVDTNRLYDIVKRLKEEIKQTERYEEYQRQEQAQGQLGRLGYAWQSNEGKYSGLVNVHDAERRTTAADERVRRTVDNDRKQDLRSDS